MKTTRREWLRYLLLAGLLLVLALPVSHAALKEREPGYQGGGVTMRGYLVYDDRISGKRPGVLVVHEWWGHNERAGRQVTRTTPRPSPARCSPTCHRRAHVSRLPWRC